jgi:hypothetical protein
VADENFFRAETRLMGIKPKVQFRQINAAVVKFNPKSRHATL